MAVVIGIGFMFLFYFRPPIDKYGMGSNYPIPAKESYSDGKLRANGLKLNNRKHGKWTFYDKDGKIEKELVFKNGEIVKEDGE